MAGCENGIVEVALEGGYATAAVRASERVMRVAAMFGIGVDERMEARVVSGVRLRLRAGRVVLVTGASGGGKTTLLRLLRRELEAEEGVTLIDFEAMMRGAGVGGALVDSVGETLEEAVRWLSLAGLNDAWLMVRSAGELSAGQSYRWGLARAMASVESGSGVPESRVVVVLMDEFVSLLDRQTAGVVARNVRKWADRSGVCVVAATAHDDVLEWLEPDVLVVQEPGEGVEVLERERGGMTGDR